MIGVEPQRLLEALRRIRVPPHPQQTGTARVYGVPLKLTPVQAVRLGERAFAIELTKRLVEVVLCQTDESEQPVQTERRIAIAAIELPILDGRALSEHGFRVMKMSARDVHHCRLKVGEREVRIEGERRGGRVQAFAAPRRVAEAEEMPPVRRLEPDRTSR